MKNKILYIVLLIMGNMVYAETEFGWSVAEWGITYNGTHNNLIHEMKLLPFDLLIFDKVNINVSGLNIQLQFQEAEKTNFVILPTELGIVPWVVHWKDAYFLPFVVYGKGSWLFDYKGDNNFYGSIGIRTSLFIRPGYSNYVMPITAFFEYTTARELRLGISVDLLTIVLLFGTLI